MNFTDGKNPAPHIQIMSRQTHLRCLEMDIVQIRAKIFTVMKRGKMLAPPLRIAVHGVYRTPTSYLGSPILRVMMSDATVNLMAVKFLSFNLDTSTHCYHLDLRDTRARCQSQGHLRDTRALGQSQGHLVLKKIMVVMLINSPVQQVHRQRHQHCLLQPIAVTKAQEKYDLNLPLVSSFKCLS